MNQINNAALVMGIGCVVTLYVVLQSRLGVGLMATPDDEAVSETLGVEIFRSKL